MIKYSHHKEIQEKWQEIYNILQKIQLPQCSTNKIRQIYFHKSKISLDITWLEFAPTFPTRSLAF